MSRHGQRTRLTNLATTAQIRNWFGNQFVPAIGGAGPGGGIVFYIAPTTFTGGPLGGQMKYLEAAPSGWNGGSEPQRSWSTGANQTIAVSGADGTAIGTGWQNSLDIANQSGNVAASCAAVLARGYAGNGFTDWYLPSKDELNQFYLQQVVIGGVVASQYWTSSEVGTSNAYRQFMNNGIANTDNKFRDIIYVRPIRAFNV